MSLPYHKGLLNERGITMLPFYALVLTAMWLPWRMGQKRANGKMAKVPVVPATGRSDGWTEAGSAVTYEEALKYAEEHGLAGVGVVMGPTTALGTIMLDIDDAIGGDGRAAAWAAEILKPRGKVETYVEFSPSGKGFRVVAYDPTQTGIEISGNNVEVYDGTSTRFLTITGDRIASAPEEATEARATIRATLARANVRTDGANQGGTYAQATKSGSAKAKASGAGGTPPLDGLPLDVAKGALAAFPCAGRSRDDWRKVGMGLSHQYGESVEAFEAWDQWSAEDASRYDSDETAAQWAGFGQPRDGRAVTLAYLLKKAGETGWKQPARDVTSGFEAVEGEDGAAGGAPEAKAATGAKGCGSKGTETWPDVLPLTADKRGLTVPVWPEGTLPTFTTGFARNVAARTGGDELAALASALPFLGSLVPACLSFEPRGASDWRCPPTFFVGTVGDSGTTKSPVMNALVRPLEALEATRSKEHRAAMARHKRALEVAKKAGGGDLPPLPPKPWKRSTTNATPEGAAKLISRTDEGLTVLPDELTGFFGSLDRYSGGGGKTGSGDRAFWLSSYEGKPHSSHRSNELNNIEVVKVRCSVVGTIQPPVLSALLDTLGTDGLLQRFWLVPVGNRNMSQNVPPDLSGAEVYAKMVRLIVDIGADDLGAEIMLTADPEAAEVSREAERWDLSLQATLPTGDALRGVLAKSRGAVARLTIAVHVVAWAEEQAVRLLLGEIEEAEALPVVVTGATAKKALEVWQRCFWPATVRAHREAAAVTLDRDVQDLAELARDTVRGGKDSFSAWDVERRFNRFRREGRAALEKAADKLVAKHWLREVKRNGGTVWTINPAVRDAA